MPRYHLSQSPLYKVTSPSQLAKRLDLDINKLEKLVNRGDNYARFYIGTTKKRAVQEPKIRLRALHKRIAIWLGRIETPEYLHSALLAKALTVDEHLPTGSPVSPILSYFAHKRLFDRIADLATEHELVFTVYMDDMCLSGALASRKILFKVRQIIASHGFKSHKCRFFPAGIPREVTGVALTASGIRLPHRRHLEIHKAFSRIKSLPSGAASERELRAIMGRMSEAAQLEPVWRERVRSFRASHTGCSAMESPSHSTLSRYASRASTKIS